MKYPQPLLWGLLLWAHVVGMVGLEGLVGLGAHAASLSTEQLQQWVSRQLPYQQALQPYHHTPLRALIRLPQQRQHVLPAWANKVEDVQLSLHLPQPLPPTSYWLAKVEVHPKPGSGAAKHHPPVAPATPTTWMLPLTVQHQGTVWVLTQPLAAQSPINPQHLRKETRWLDGLQATEDLLATELPHLAEYYSLSPLPAGAVLQRNRLKQRPLVEANHPIRIQFSLGAAAGEDGGEGQTAGPLLLEAEGIALENGYLGPRIAVKETQYRKRRFYGVVLNKTTVRVVL